MTRLTDITLSRLDGYDPSPEQLVRLCGLLIETGADRLELSVGALLKMGSRLPPFPRYILRCEKPSQTQEFSQFDTFLLQRRARIVPPGVVIEIQINDLREIPLLVQTGPPGPVRVTGLDDIMSFDYAPAFSALRQTFKGRLSLCPENRCHCATAIAVEWLLSGGEEAAASFGGIGGLAATEEVAMALRLEVRRKPNLDFQVFPKIKALLEDITGEPFAKNKPVVGDEIFSVEAGIHIDGITKNPAIYEPFPPQLVGAARKLVLGKHSGQMSIRLKIDELGLSPDGVNVTGLLTAVRRESVRLERSLTDGEFAALYQEIQQSPNEKKEGDA